MPPAEGRACDAPCAGRFAKLLDSVSMKNSRMKQTKPFRRRLVLTAAASLLLLPGLAAAQVWKQVEAAVKQVGSAPVLEQGLQLNLPLVAEDGSSVPLTVISDASGAGRITRLAIFAPANPTPEVAVYEFGDAFDKLNLSTRIRLSESQTVIAVAHTADGKAIVAERAVRVTVSGCIAPAKSDPAAEMKARVRVPKKWDKNGGEVLTMISHPMITGLVADDTGNTPAQRIVQSFTAKLDGTPVLKARFFRSLAANPYLKFDMAPTQSGILTFEWVEDTGRKVEVTETVNLG